MASQVGVNQPKLQKALLRYYLFAKPLYSSSWPSAPSIASTAIDPSLIFIPSPQPPTLPSRIRVDSPAASTSTTTTATAAPTLLDLNNTAALFRTLSTPKLWRSAANLHAAAVEPMVDLGTWVMKSRLMETPVVKDFLLGSIKHSFYEHFCAGEDTVSAGETVKRLNDVGFSSMLDYALEFSDDNQSCDRNFHGFLRTVEFAKSLPPSSVSSVVVKITAICPMRVLQRMSDLLRWQYKDPSLDLPWKLKTFTIFSSSSPLYHTLQKPDPLTADEVHDLQLAHERLAKLCQKCVEANVPLTIDAEHTTVQPAIDYFTYSSAILYNKDYDKPIVYGTIQAYLKDARERLLLASEASDQMGVSLGVKLVRGAYMSSESKLASSLGFESPIHNTIRDTHACFNGCASYMIDRIASGSGLGVILATHNVDSGNMAARKVRERGMEKVEGKLQFAQLYGMAEALSFGLRNAGFQVSKYMPFGPVDKIMPYLLRRAEENRGLLSASSIDRDLMRKEIKRRLFRPRVSSEQKHAWF